MAVKKKAGKPTDGLVELKLHPNWVHLIGYCGASHQAGYLGLKVEKGVPVKRVSVGTKKDIRFRDAIPPLFVRDSGPLLTVRVTNKWKHFIEFTETRIPYGQVCISIAGGEPDKFIEKYSAHDINFGHPESFPEVFFVFNEYQNSP